MLNKSLGDHAYNILDLGSGISDGTLEKLRKLDGVVKVRKL